MRDTIVVRNGLLECGELEDVDDGGEDLLVDDLSIWADFDDRWLDVVAWASDSVSTVEDASTLRLNLLESFSVVADAVRVVQGAHQSLAVHGVTNGHRLVCLDHAGHEGVIDGVVKIDSSERSASLSACSHGGEDATLEGELEVSIGHDDGCVVTSKLKDSLSEASVDVRTDATTDSSRASEGDKGDARVLDHGVANV